MCCSGQRRIYCHAPSIGQVSLHQNSSIISHDLERIQTKRSMVLLDAQKEFCVLDRHSQELCDCNSWPAFAYEERDNNQITGGPRETTTVASRFPVCMLGENLSKAGYDRILLTEELKLGLQMACRRLSGMDCSSIPDKNWFRHLPGRYKHGLSPVSSTILCSDWPARLNRAAKAQS